MNPLNSSQVPQRVLTVIDSLLAGGAERVAVELACALDRDCFTPHVLVTRGTGPLQSLLDEAQVDYTVLDRSRRLDRRAWRTALKLARQSDLIHAHKFGSNAWGAMLARRAHVPLITHEHNFSPTESRLRTLVNRRYIAATSQRVLCVSATVAEAEQARGIPEALLQVVPNAVQLDAALSRDDARAELGIKTQSAVIGIVGRLRPEKAHDVLIRAFGELVRSGLDVRLCVVGDGPCRADLKHLAATLGVSQRIIWAGERRSAARLASAFDMSVICSHWEGLPLAALESLAASVPLVATRVGALPELIGDDAGMLVAPGDDAALSQALRALVCDPERARSLGRTGKQRIAAQYAFQPWVDSITSMYDAVLGQQPAALTTPYAKHDAA